jgi:hypothetical protein
MKTIAQQYDDWATKVTPASASDADRQALKRAFYGGVRAAFTSFVLINQFDVDATVTDRWLDDVGKELIAFNEEMKEGRA